MAPVTKKRRVEDEVRRPKKKIRVKKQKAYHSSSEDESDDGVPVVKTQNVEKAKPKSILKSVGTTPVQEAEDEEEAASDIEGLEDLDEAERNAALNAITQEGAESGSEEEGEKAEDAPSDENEVDEDSGSQSETSMTSGQATRSKKKRNDPAAFATSISKILDTKLSTQKRNDPVLSRSQNAAKTTQDLADSKLDHAARAQIRSERRQALQKGRVTDVLGLQDSTVDTGKVQEEEKRLKKTAQRGVVKLFNAVRAAQVKAEEGMRQARSEGVVGQKQREERVAEMSKEGFLEMISRGGGATTA